MDFVITAGQANDCTQAIPLLGERKTGHMLAEKGYDSARKRLRAPKISGRLIEMDSRQSQAQSTPISMQGCSFRTQFLQSERSEVVYDWRSKSFADSDTNFRHRSPV